jgi:hypothetical protein
MVAQTAGEEIVERTELGEIRDWRDSLLGQIYAPLIERQMEAHKRMERCFGYSKPHGCMDPYCEDPRHDR